ncbi:glycosyl hydrolase family 20 [Drepanopeziza brunnea f. sp. 'multigermtubi' MB_m1]|uniref:Beta-hexosaminidase n=1 Tax=Marssonina brunnea f. sp. multigermtubi (strain MB_m1) TaxID=1072389 RepID=K1WV46_MARBU|nr:glycosyl hydrolase family 20 [Drepanopeziza brunnea f. sp. 'multigermtubi' MB_m1]EKD12523.1 glycosyl hydrolase family 20 [Drepanopeziza brunnea f. sp. 'multigermtubi' MB_m1]
MFGPLYLFFYLIAPFAARQVVAIWPAPQSFSNGTSVLWLARNFHVNYDVLHVQPSLRPGHEDEDVNEEILSTGDFSSHSIVQAAISRALDTLWKHSLVPWKLHARNQLSAFEPAKESSSSSRKQYIKSLRIIQSSVDTASTFKPRAGEVDESYSLKVSLDGTARITAVSPIGVLHGLETFVQLFYKHSSGSGIYTNLAPVDITDAPIFPHRGLNMDVARNWFPVSDILRTIDALSMNKFNRLHIHMTDSQSWPLDVPALPELAQKGAYQTGLSYSPADFKKMQTYAVEHGVEMIVEFDMPGHTSSIGYAYPDLVAGFDARPWDTYCNEPPCGSLKLNSPEVSAFLNTLFSDVLPRVQPYSAYFHTGGDEVNKQVYLLDDTVQSNDSLLIGSLIQKMVDRNHDQIRKAGMTPIVWEEMLLEWGLTLGSDVLVQSWLSDESVAQITGKGHKVVTGNYHYWYLDCGKGQWLNFRNGNSFQKYYPFKDYCDPFHNWRLVYSYDPLAGVPANQTHLVMGGEVHIWSEQTDPVNLDDMVWPRASAAGEVLWSGRQDAGGQNRSQIDASPRLAEMRERMVSRGIGAGPVQMVFCTQSDAAECSL